MKSFLQNNDIEIVNKYNNTYHCTIKMKTESINFNSSKENNEKDPKFRVGGIVRISKYKNIFAKGYTPNWSEEVFVIKKIQKLCRGLILLMMLTMKKLWELFTKKNFKKQIKMSLEFKR